MTFRRAGHILGAATVDMAWQGRRIVFTGDLGRYDDPIMFDPEPVPAADYLVMESTYGDRVHEQTDPADVLAEVVDATVKRGGTVVMPAFAVGRAQTLLYYLWQLREAGRLPDVPVYLDSPMAINASELLGTYRDDHRLPPEVYEGMCAMATYTRDAEQSMRISASTEPKIVISASGMATGGRILHHLKAFAPDPRNTIMITGYQVPGTRGAAIANGERFVRIYGEWVPINAAGRQPGDAVGPRRRRRTPPLGLRVHHPAATGVRGARRTAAGGHPALPAGPRVRLAGNGSQAEPAVQPVRLAVNAASTSAAVVLPDSMAPSTQPDHAPAKSAPARCIAPQLVSTRARSGACPGRSASQVPFENGSLIQSWP